MLIISLITPLLQSSVSNDSSEMILICWFETFNIIKSYRLGTWGWV